jgi:hypothetical protein
MTLPRGRRVALLVALAALAATLVAWITVTGPQPAGAEPHCPVPNPNPSLACGDLDPTTTTTRRANPNTPPPPPPVALDPQVFIEVAGACVAGPVGSTAAGTMGGLLGGHTHSTCVGSDLRVGTWPSYQSPSAGAAVRRLEQTTARGPGETYAVRIAERNLQDAFGKIMESRRSQIEGGGRRLTSYTTDMVAPDTVSSRITVKKTVLGFEGRATAIIADRLFVRDGNLVCSTRTDIDTNAAADLGQALGDLGTFLLDTSVVDIRGRFRSELDRAGTPGCQLATLVPDHVLLPNLPGVGALRVDFTASRAQVTDGHVLVGGTWAQRARQPGTGIGIVPGAGRWVNGAYEIPVSVTPRDLSGTSTVTVSVNGVARATVQVPGHRGQETPGTTVTVRAPIPFSETARATIGVSATDADGITSPTASRTWLYIPPREPVGGGSCDPLVGKPGAQPVFGGCNTPGINPGDPPVASLNPQPEPPGAM